MPEVIEIPIELTQFQLPQAVQDRLNLLLDHQDEGCTLSLSERQEAEGLVELAEFFSLLSLRSTRVMKVERKMLISSDVTGSSVKRDTLIGILTNENGCKAYSVGEMLKPFPGKLSRLKLISIDSDELFHVKAYYLVENESQALTPYSSLVIGSANLTKNGITSNHGNIELLFYISDTNLHKEFYKKLEEISNNFSVELSEIDDFSKDKKKHQRYLKFHLITNGYFIKHIGKTTSILDITYEYDKANYGSLDDNDDGTLQETDKHLELFEGLKKEIQNIFKKHNKFHHVDWGDYAVKTVFGHWIPKYLVQYLNEWNEQKYKSDITSFWDSQELVIKKEVHKHISNYMSKNRLTEKWFKNILGSRGYDGFLKNYNIKESIRVDCLKDEDLRDKISKDIVDFIMEDKKQEFLKYGQELVLRYEISDISDFIEINYVKIIDKFYDDLCNPQNCHQKIPNKKDRISDIIKKYEGNLSVIQENLKPDDFLES